MEPTSLPFESWKMRAAVQLHDEERKTWENDKGALKVNGVVEDEILADDDWQ